MCPSRIGWLFGMKENALKKNVYEIIELLMSNESALTGIKSYIKEYRLEAILFILGLIMATVGIVSIFVYPSISSLFFMLFFICIVVHGLTSTVTSVKFFINATKWTMDNIRTRYDDNFPMAEKLSKYDDKALEQVISLFNGRIHFLKVRVGLLVGALEKLGVIPAVVMLYFSHAKVFDKQDIFEMPPLVLGIVSGVYIGAISARIVSDSLNDKISILELARKLRNSRNTYKLKE